MSDGIRASSAEALARSVASGERSAVEVAEAFLRQIDRSADRLRTYLHRAPQLALTMARDVDRRRSSGETASPSPSRTCW
jgi:Asp-tRNA(Asn)/Glu-tRNA(Gln) amidotransferase A subunit family amidase